MHPVTLFHGPVTLRPLTVDDAPALRALIDEAMWAGMSSPMPRDDAEMRAHLEALMAPESTLAFAVELDGEVVGRTAFYDHVPGLRVEVGNTFYARDVWGGIVNPSAKLLMFGYAFGELGVERVSLRCDHRNARSHAAIARLGARFEGTLRRFRPAADGTIADVDYFSIVREEWAAVRAGLEARVAAELEKSNVGGGS
ncbi:GNAT family N-acetyltransferase [Pseudoclavibacter alba]|uniref:GNAT family N-acetyltransferase n=1 Tax=Pseudoclavibacter albus TaxID=272241 RepID=UPI0019D2D6CD|nr:GNAT family protein [Pseudoclavibacter alba]MBN6777012.1 GNAT family N-acetyltransferase [Pseudoclavibacter alba]